MNFEVWISHRDFHINICGQCSVFLLPSSVQRSDGFVIIWRHHVEEISRTHRQRTYIFCPLCDAVASVNGTMVEKESLEYSILSETSFKPHQCLALHWRGLSVARADGPSRGRYMDGMIHMLTNGCSEKQNVFS